MQWQDYQSIGVPRDVDFKNGERLGDTADYRFHPATSIQDAFWVMDTLSKTHNDRFLIESDPKCECTVTSKNLSQNVTGIGSSLPLATVQMALYLMAHQYPANSNKQELLFALSHDLYDTKELTVNYEEYIGEGLVIDLDKYLPRCFAPKAPPRENLPGSMFFSVTGVPVHTSERPSQQSILAARNRLISVCTFVPRFFQETLHT